MKQAFCEQLHQGWDLEKLQFILDICKEILQNKDAFINHEI